MSENKNFIAFLGISLLIILTYDLLFLAPDRERRALQQAQNPEAVEDSRPSAEIAGPGDTLAPEQVADTGPRIRIDTPALEGSLSLRGGRIDDLVLRNYKTSIEEDAGNVRLLKRFGQRDRYYANVGWSGVGDTGDLPGPSTDWTADREVLTADRPVTLRWTNAKGLTFLREIAVDETALFTITQRVVNDSGEPVKLAPYAFVERRTKPEISGIFILHEGGVGVLDGVLEKASYSKMSEEGTIARDSTGGWIGFTDKYWLVAAAPAPDEPVKARFYHTDSGGVQKYQTDYIGRTRTLAPGETAAATTRLFTGAKTVETLARYERAANIEGLDRAVDWGWFWFLTRPFFWLLDNIQDVVGNFGLSILILTLLVKIVFYPLASKSYESMARMKLLQPKMKALQERYKDDREKLSQELMGLYKKEKVNPAAGCLPILIQIPVFFALYKVLFVTIEMRHAPFFGWIQDLSAPDPATLLTLFGWVQWEVPAILSLINIGIWPILMGIFTYLQFKLNPQQGDPMQQRIFQLLPLFMVFVVANFPAGLVIYWTWNTILSAAQQWLILKRSQQKANKKKLKNA